MRYRKADIVARAVDALDAHGLAGLSMRALATDLGLQPSALYHHFAAKRELLAAVADELLRRHRRAAEVVAWEAELRLVCVEVRDAMRSHRDGAALVAGVYAAGGAREPERRMTEALSRAGAPAGLARVGARTLQRFVLAHVDEDDVDFALGLGVILAGLERHVGR